jgi:hypothetical protein
MRLTILLASFLLWTGCGGEAPARPKAEDLAPLIVPVSNEPVRVPAPEIKRDPLVEAMDLLKKFKADPSDAALKTRVAEAFLRLARDAADRGDKAKAKAYWGIVMQADPQNGEARKALAAGTAGPESLGLNVVGSVEEAENPSGLRMGTYHFSVRISGPAQARTADQVVNILEEAYLKVCGAMGANPDGKVPVVLYTDREFHDTTGLPPWVGGAYNGIIHLPVAGLDVSNSLVRKVIVHEFVHAFNFQVSQGACPTWLDEGLAQYFEEPRPPVRSDHLLDSASAGTLPDLASPSFLLGSREDTGLLYTMSLAAVRYLVQRASLGAVSSFLQKLGSGEELQQAFQDTFLFPYARLQADTLAWLPSSSR